MVLETTISVSVNMLKKISEKAIIAAKTHCLYLSCGQGTEYITVLRLLFRDSSFPEYAEV